MITLQTSKAQLELDLENINEPLLRVDNRIRACVSDLNEALVRFWGLPDDRLLDILNFFGIEQVENLFSKHYKYATSFKELLEERNVESVQPLLERQKEITFNNETNLFEIKSVSLPDQLSVESQIAADQYVDDIPALTPEEVEYNLSI